MGAEPTRVRANTTVYWERSLPNYDATTWTASYKLYADNLAPITISATGSGTEYTVDAKPVTTTDWAAGEYAWILLVTDGTDTFEIDRGTIEVIAETATGNDLLDARRYLESAETELAARASGKPSSYSIKDRSLTRASVQELQRIVKYWRARVRTLENQERRRRGLKANNITYARFQ